MANQVKSPRLEGNRLKRAQRESTFTLKNAAVYWAGYLEIRHKDIDASAEYKQIYQILIEAVENGDLELQERKIESSGGGVTWATNEPIPYKNTTHWQACKVKHEVLRTFAESVGEKPKFLFSETENVEAGFSEREAPTLEKMLSALIKVHYGGDDALLNIKKERSNLTGKIIRDISAICRLSEKKMRDVLKRIS